MPNVLPIPNVLDVIKKTIEEIEQLNHMDAIKIDWHSNKNELFVNDF